MKIAQLCILLAVAAAAISGHHGQCAIHSHDPCYVRWHEWGETLGWPNR